MSLFKRNATSGSAWVRRTVRVTMRRMKAFVGGRAIGGAIRSALSFVARHNDRPAPPAREESGGPVPKSLTPADQAYAKIRHMARKHTQPVKPSFAASLDAKVRRQRYAEKTLNVRTFSLMARRRNEARHFVTALGFQMAALYRTDFPLSALPEAARGLDRFAVKPVHATNAWGVMGLVRIGDNRFRDVLRGEEHEIGSMLARLRQPMKRYHFPDKWLTEELLIPPGGEPGPLHEYKFYAFRGSLPLILQVGGFGPQRRYKWYDADWRPVRTGKYEDRLDLAMPPPLDAVRLTEGVRRLSLALPVPFCRIDAIETHGGFHIGELTPEPGNYQAFSPEIDHLLGIGYEQSEARLVAALKEGDLALPEGVVPL